MKGISTEIIHTTEQVRTLVNWLVFHHTLPVPHPLTIYIDLEGTDLCRQGSISFVTLLIDTGISTRRVCLIDVHELGAQAFNTAGVKRKTLKDIFEDAGIPKVFFDVQNDSDALYAHFNIALQGVQNVQLMESATRTTTRLRKLLNGLRQCVEQSAHVLPVGDVASWKLAKEEGERSFKAEPEIFNRRPISPKILSYCIGDVQYLPELRDRFWNKQVSLWQDLVKEESQRRVTASQQPEYRPHSRDRAVAAWSKIPESEFGPVESRSSAWRLL